MILQILATPLEMIGNVWRGLCVLSSELCWLFGEDRAFRRHISPLRRRILELQSQMAELTLTANSGSRKTELSLALIEKDLRSVLAARQKKHQTRLAGLIRRFPKEFGDAPNAG